MRASHHPSLSLTLACLLLTLTGHAQNATSPASPNQLSPGAAYTDALHPLEVTRHNIANWSDVELAAMTVAIRTAKASCDTRKASDYTNADLVDLARLCSLGQQWPAVIAASTRYIDDPTQPKPLLTDAYTAKTEAHLHLKQEPEALTTALALLAAVPYTTEASQCIDEALDYMRFVHTADALKLASARQQLVLAALGTPPTSSPDQPSISTLYANGLSLAILQQLASRPNEAQATVAALDAALPANTSGDDKLRIAGQRRQYALLGKPLSGINPLASLSSPTNKIPELPAHSTLTALLLFPDWCAQCVYMGPHLPETVFKVEGHSAYLYALLAQTVPPRKPDPTVTNKAYNPAYAAALLAETPTITVPPETLNRFEATDFPLLLVTDPDGILRVLEPVSAQDLQPGGSVDAAIALVGKTFLLTPSPSTVPATAHVAPH